MAERLRVVAEEGAGRRVDLLGQQADRARPRAEPFEQVRGLVDAPLPGEEGAFLLCSFWLVDALLAADRGKEAEALFEELLTRSNDLGLYAEQCGEDGAFLGNFPQAFTHLGVIHSAMALQLYRRDGVAGVAGSYADRADRIVERDDRHRLAWSAVGRD